METEPLNNRDFPKMPEPGGRAHLLESAASMFWTVLFLAYSSSTFTSEFPTGWPAAWTVLLIMTPICLAGIPNILDHRKNAVPNLLAYIICILLPSFLQLSKPAVYPSLHAHIADFLTVVFLWLPLEFGLLSKDISPTGKVTMWGLLTVALNIVNCFIVLHPFSKTEKASPLGYTFKVTPLQLGIAIVCAVVYIILTVPLAALIRFGRLKIPPRLTPSKEFAIFFGLFMSAVTEELLFRGVIQNMLEQRFGRHSLIPVALAALAFALAHVRKEKLGYMAPNSRYAAVSFVAGYFCGLSWRYTRKVTTSALTRAIGDYVLYRVAFSKKTGQ